MLTNFDSFEELRAKMVAVQSGRCTRDYIDCAFLAERGAGCLLWIGGEPTSTAVKCHNVMYFTKENVEKHALKIITWRLKDS